MFLSKPGDEWIIDDLLFVVSDCGLSFLPLSAGPHVRARAQAHCLSSSTYLNTPNILIIPGWLVGVKGES